MWVESSAPSNIALIKYMGKTDVKSNRPTNSSFSFCLEKLRTFVRVRQNPELTQDVWRAYQRKDLRPIELSERGLEKFLNHFSFLKKEFKIEGFFEIESANNFPSDCGLASSASSYAALTLALHDWLIQNSADGKLGYRPKELAKLSQKGSGSSCRSFFSPWSLWHADGAESIQIPYQSLKHQVLLCDESIKSVSSSEAHVRVLTSDLFRGRVERVEARLQHLIEALRKENWKSAYEICWNEFWDMHTLFHTSVPSFMYMNDMTLKALRLLHDRWSVKQDGPLITMDAGSNIHLLYRPDQQSAYEEVLAEFRPLMPLWTDEGYLEKQ
ncbi:diphosphomevalonate/mevalonate 3,5-bisphosphate decarboxylase family protein [Pseudobdellovibrio exovorus]|uniref:Diphosphomevalonate decarboxylase n=1 Tax=Pseudobdellovibrio exovorus JSS TaxID=1184267 RepID=M4VRA6_9BACT|nr:diphosphomevalonate decarboxylase [Pseudobdellovibrio exovorus]AGH95714.1 diphosphomevalonate decarboxylase [Pseudobdellovibrio exovorus JSS]